MSGGHFDYQQYRIGGIADEIQELIDTNNDETLDEWGDTVGRGYNDVTIQQFRKAVDTLRQAQVYAHRIDWLVSGDDGEESFHQRLAEDLADAETMSYCRLSDPVPELTPDVDLLFEKNHFVIPTCT